MKASETPSETPSETSERAVSETSVSPFRGDGVDFGHSDTIRTPAGAPRGTSELTEAYSDRAMQFERNVEEAVSAKLIPPPSPARTRDPATVVDLAEARRRALPAEGDVFEHRDPVWLGDFRGQVTERPTHLGREVLLLFALVVGAVVYVLLPGAP